MIPLVIVAVLLALGGSFLLGIALGQQAERDRWRVLAKAGCRLWYLGHLYPLRRDGGGVVNPRAFVAAVKRARDLLAPSRPRRTRVR